MKRFCYDKKELSKSDVSTFKVQCIEYGLIYQFCISKSL